MASFVSALLCCGLPTLCVADESRDVVMVPHRHKDQIPRRRDKEDSEPETGTAFKIAANRPDADPRVQMRPAKALIELLNCHANPVLLLR